jgi:ABC-type transport system involved in multi-copper enzyme maturation permease subunit
MDSRIATIARYTLLEALRTRLAALVLVMLAVLLAASYFILSISIIEGTRFQAGFYAAGARFACVFTIGLYVLVSMTREFNDKGFDVLLALDLPRSHYVLGKLAGFLGIVALIALAAAIPLAMIAPPIAALQWMLSLAFELAVVAALALFCVLTFSQVTLAASFVLAFYLLARSLTAIRLMSATPIASTDTFAYEMARLLTDGLALVIPAFDAWTRTAWLVNEAAPWSALLQVAGEGVLYVALLAAAAMFDFYRKNF